MRKKPLGKTGLTVSEIGVGAIRFGSLSDDEVGQILSRAVEMGINLIDTARSYGESEARIGRVLGANRSKVILSSKSTARTADGMRRDLEASLKALRTDYIDIYKAHNLRMPEEYDGAMAPGGAVEALERAREEGLIGHIGISCHRYRDTLKRAILSERFSVVMVAYNVLNDELMDEEVLPLAKERGVGTLIMKPLAGGVLARPPESLRLAGSASEGRAITAADAIGFVLANRNVDCAVVGMSSVAELGEDVAAARQAARMGQESMAEIVRAAEAFGKDFCRSCGYCLPCSAGILIPVILRHLFYLKRYGLTQWARGRYGMVEVKADACTRCGECLEKCPYELPIPDLLEEAHRSLG